MQLTGEEECGLVRWVPPPLWARCPFSEAPLMAHQVVLVGPWTQLFPASQILGVQSPLDSTLLCLREEGTLDPPTSAPPSNSSLLRYFSFDPLRSFGGGRAEQWPGAGPPPGTCTRLHCCRCPETVVRCQPSPGKVHMIL